MYIIRIIQLKPCFLYPATTHSICLMKYCTETTEPVTYSKKSSIVENEFHYRHKREVPENQGCRFLYIYCIIFSYYRTVQSSSYQTHGTIPCGHVRYVECSNTFSDLRRGFRG